MAGSKYRKKGKYKSGPRIASCLQNCEQKFETNDLHWL
jgi:hypothetical protein